MDAKTKLRAVKLSDGQRARLTSTVEAHENRIDHAVLTLYGIDALPQ